MVNADPDPAFKIHADPDPHKTNADRNSKDTVFSNVLDTHSFYADSDIAFKENADPDLAF
jgi:hypothetical protein